MVHTISSRVCVFMSTCSLRLLRPLRPPSSPPSARVTGYQGNIPGSQGEYQVRLGGTSKRVTGYQGNTPGSQGEYHVRLGGTSKLRVTGYQGNTPGSRTIRNDPVRLLSPGTPPVIGCPSRHRGGWEALTIFPSRGGVLPCLPCYLFTSRHPGPLS